MLNTMVQRDAAVTKYATNIFRQKKEVKKIRQSDN